MSNNERKSSGQFNDRLNKQFSYTVALKILSPAETAVLDWVEKGYSNKEISDQLGVSVRTVHTHRNNICRKLGIKGRVGLLKWLWQARNGENG